MIYLIVINLISTIALALYVRKLKKRFEYKLGEERCLRHQLEEFYIQLHKDFAEHYYKYH